MKKKLLYTGAFRFLNKDAAGKRVLANGMAFRDLGFDVHFSGWESNDISVRNDERKFKGFSYCSLNELDEKKSSNIFSRVYKFIFRGNKTIYWLENNIDNFDVIVVYNPPSVFSLKLLLYCKRKKIKLILDSTEWYEGSHLVGGKFGLVSIENFIRMHVVYKFFKNKIVISEYLYDFYHNSKVMKIPPLLPMKKVNITKKSFDATNINVIYAGSPGKKDDIFSFIMLLPRLNLELDANVRLTLVGPDIELISKSLDCLGVDFPVLEQYLDIKGFVPHSDVECLYKSADFSIIFRDDKRFAWAGFPTKFVESISNGVPVISNKVGDIVNYLSNGDVGHLIEVDNLYSELYMIFNEYSGKTEPDKITISNNCYEMAERCFMYNKFDCEFKRLL